MRTKKLESLTWRQAAGLVSKSLRAKKHPDFNLSLTSIDKDVAHELAKVGKWDLSLKGLTSIDKDSARELSLIHI